MERDNPRNATEPQGTMRCPVCALDHPHGHSVDELADRPHIDWARAQFEDRLPELLGSADSESLRASAHIRGWIRNVEDDCWSHRFLGDYYNPLVQLAWAMWRAGWLAAKRHGDPHA